MTPREELIEKLSGVLLRWESETAQLVLPLHPEQVDTRWEAEGPLLYMFRRGELVERLADVFESAARG